MSKVKVSIIVPVYNQEKRIKGCLESLKNLAFHDAEFLIINDGSVDKTEEVISEFINKSQDSRFKLLSKNNEGPGAARNYGIERARGEYSGLLMVMIGLKRVLFWKTQLISWRTII